MRKSILYINIFLFIVASLFAVNAFSASGHSFIQKALAAVGNITGQGTVNYIARFASGANPSNMIGDSIIYDDGAGHVGIGTTGPTGLLNLYGASNMRKALTITETANGGYGTIYFSGKNGSGTNNTFELGINAYADNLFTISDGTAATPGFSMTNTGNVGIGTTNPAWLLEINKNSPSAATGQYPAISVNNPNASGYGGYYFYQGVTQLGGMEANVGNGNVTIFTQATKNLLMQTGAGNVGIGTTNPGAKLHVVGDALFGTSLGTSPVYASDYYFTNTGGAGIWMSQLCRSDGTNCPASTGGQWTTSGTNIYNSNSGNVGIGTTGPSKKLEVYGSGVGQIRTNDGSGHNADFGVSAAAPSYAVGIWYGGNQQMNIGSRGLALGSYVNVDPPADSLIVSGNVGIGTTTPANTLDVKSTGSSTVIGLITPSYGADAFRLMNSDGSLRISSGVATNLLNLVGSNVGIGTTAPSQALEVKTTGTTAIAVNGGASSNANILFQQNGTNRGFLFYENATGVMTLNRTGSSGDGLNVNSSGNVGIGTTTPGSKLDIAGGDINMDNGTSIYSRGRMHLFGEELLYLLNKSGVIVSKAWGGNGNLTVEGSMMLTPLASDPPGLTNGMMWMRQ